MRQRIVALTLGYEDLDDHNTLRNDILLQTAVGHDPRLAYRTTLGRFERRVVDEQTTRRLQSLLVELFIEEHAEPPERVVLDFGATDDVVHGNRERRAFNTFYDA